MEENIIIRTEKIREIGEALKAKNILYISAFYGSGKTVLLDQTAAVAEALTLARKYKLLRVIADEGAPADSMIKALKPRKDDWLNAVLRLTQLQAGYYPGYMAKQSERSAKGYFTTPSKCDII